MLEMLAVHAKEWVSYKDVSLKFDSPLIVIRGKNLDASSNEDAANRTGKSLIPAIVPRIAFDATPQPVKAPRKAKHAMRKGTCLSWDIKKGANRYRIEKYLDRTARVRIIEDKRNRGIRLKATGDAALQEIFPLNEDQFYSTVYIDARRPSLLQYGSDANRFQFFEQVFDLGIYKALSDKLKPELQSSLRVESERDILQDQLAALDSVPNIDKLKSALTVKQARLADQRKKIDRWRSHKRRLQIYCDAAAQIPDGKKEDVEALHERMNALSERIDAGIAAIEQTRLYAETEKTRLRLNDALENYADIKIDKELPSRLAALHEAYNLAFGIYEEYQENKQNLEEATRTRDVIQADESVKALTLPRLERDLLKARSRIEFITRLQTALAGSLAHEKVCPVCASEFSEENHAAFETRIAKNLKAAQQKARILHDGIRWVKQDAIVKQFAKLCARQPKSDHVALEAEYKTQEALLEKMKRKSRILRRIADLPVIEKPDAVENLTALRAENMSLLQRVNKANAIEQARKIIESLKLTVSLDDARKTLKRYDQILPENEAQLEALEHSVIDLQTRIKNAEQTQQTIASLTQTIADLDKQLEEQPILEALRVAFGSKGLVKQRTQKLAAAFQGALNDYASFVYDEIVTFRLDVTETRFSILATRNGIEDDVRSFSGQESRAFSLITMLSLLRFMPNHLRCNAIFLDEIEANMDASSRRLFVDKFIPELQKFVKTILIVTPQSRADFFIPEAQEYYAVKKNGVSNLVRFEDMGVYNAA